jgi:hypothetical protein
MNPSRLLARASALSFLASSAACGSLSGETTSHSTLATIHGTIVEADSTAPSSTHLATALVWPTGASKVAANAPVTTTFPASFTIDLTEPPPDVAITDVPVTATLGVREAEAVLVAYEDLNQNGQLDLVTGGQYVDKVVGWSKTSGVSVVYFDGSLPPGASNDALSIPGDDGSLPRAGYNLKVVRRNVCTSVDGGSTCADKSSWKPIGTSITLPIGGASPDVQAAMDLVMCSPGAVLVFALPSPNCADASCALPVSAFPGPLPAPNDPDLQCFDENSFASFERCVPAITDACHVKVNCAREFYSLAIPGSATVPPPPGWPCGAAPTP